MSRRRVGFIIAIGIGMALGLWYGWMVNPVRYVNTTPDTLRADYQLDYVLMVAEAYQARGDLSQAVHDLARLGSQPAGELTRQMAAQARKMGYAPADLTALDGLARALETWTPAPPREATP